MADEKATPSTGDVNPEPSQDVKPETVPYGRFKEINDKLRELEAERAKRDEAEKKAAEEKLRDQGKKDELLKIRDAELETERARNAELSAQAKKYQEQQERIRGEALNKIQDPELKKLAEKLPDPADVLEFANKITPREAPYSGRGASPAETDRFAKRPGESITDWSMRVDREIASRK